MEESLQREGMATECALNDVASEKQILKLCGSLIEALMRLRQVRAACKVQQINLPVCRRGLLYTEQVLIMSRSSA